MVSVLLHECERQMQDTGSRCMSVVHCTDTEQALSIQTKQNKTKIKSHFGKIWP